MVSQVGVVYDLASKEVRSVIVPDTDEQLVTVKFHSDEEGMLTLPFEEGMTLDAIIATANERLAQ